MVTYTAVLRLLSLLGSLDLLGLAGARPGPGLPPGWKVRAVMGRAAPEVDVRLEGDERVLRIRSAGRAAWFFRDISPAIPEAAGALQWSWRVLAAPADADLRWKASDDSPIRVYVVFGGRRLFGGLARVLFYSFGRAEPAEYDGPSHAGDRYHIIRVDGAAEHKAWRDHVAHAFADYRRVWGRNPPSITAIGVMQDTDQTGQPAVAELRRLEWVTR